MLRAVRSPWRNLLPALGFLSLAMVLGGAVFQDRVASELRRIIGGENLRVARLAALALARPGVDPVAEVTKIAHESDARVTLILAGGEVVADSSSDPEGMESHADRPEVLEAIANGTGEATRRSATLGFEMLYTAVRVGAPDEATGSEGGGATRVVRVARSLESVEALLASIDRTIWIATAVAILVSLLGCYFLIEVRLERQERIRRAEPPEGPPGA